jgi:hypothetical protein
MKITLTFLILTLASFAFAQGESKCFQNQSLQGANSVTFEANGNKIAGTFAVENDSGSSKTYEFTGARAGDVLTVKFYKNQLPDVAPSVLKSLIWMLSTKEGEEILRIKFYGKNYDTNKYADYIAEFEPCEPSYAKLQKMSKVLQFAKGKSSATAPLSFGDTNERKVFSVNIRRGQTLSIEAVSCKISVYLPTGKPYKFVEWKNENGTEKTFTDSMIDQITIKPIPQTGIYTVVLQKMAEEAQPHSVTFKITN